MAKKELLVGLGLIVLLFIIFNPWNMFMPGYLVMGFLIAAIVLYIAFATFLWREGRGDEREQFHRLFADRIAYLPVRRFCFSASSSGSSSTRSIRGSSMRSRSW